MLQAKTAFSGFSVKDNKTTVDFYSNILDLKITESPMGLLLHVGGGNPIFVYQKDDHEPATYTMLNFAVDDIDQVVEGLSKKGVTFESYDFGGGAKTDDTGIMRGLAAKQGPDIAWFKDPSGNILSVLQES